MSGFQPGIDALLLETEGLTKPSRAQIEAMQLRKLNALLRREHARGGFYGSLPERLSSLREMEKLPFTTDEDLAGNPGALLLTSQADIARVLSDATSGTTGRPKRVFYTDGDCENTVRLFMAGLGELIFPGSVTMICMPFSGPQGLGELIAEAIARLGARPLKTGAGRSYGELKRILEVERPDTFVGMPVPLLSMLRVCGAGTLKRALISADACPGTVVGEIERMLGSRLFPHYGSREMCLGGAICCSAHEGMHLRENHVIAEIVDENGRPVPDGVTGELVITTVGMEAMPLIRYRTGDYTRVIPGRCACGSEALRLDTVRRHSPDSVERLDGLVFRDRGIADYRITRNGGCYELELLRCGDADLPALEELLRGELKAEVRLDCRDARPEDGPLYRGKRCIMQGGGDTL